MNFKDAIGAISSWLVILLILAMPLATRAQSSTTYIAWGSPFYVQNHGNSVGPYDSLEVLDQMLTKDWNSTYGPTTSANKLCSGLFVQHVGLRKVPSYYDGFQTNLIYEAYNEDTDQACSEWVNTVQFSAYAVNSYPRENLGEPCCLGVGNPVNLSSGNKYQKEIDFQLNKWLNVIRYYNSDPTGISGDLSFGKVWRSGYQSHIYYQRTVTAPVGQTDQPPTTGTVIEGAIVQRPDGKNILFQKVNGQWVSDPLVPDVLSQTYDGNNQLTGWTFRRSSDNWIERYDATGHLVALIDEDGLTSTLSYSDGTTDPSVAPFAGLLLRVTDPNGRSLTFTYDGNAHINQVNLPDNTYISYQYGTGAEAYRDLLLSATFPDNSTRKYDYNDAWYINKNLYASGYLTSITDESSVTFATYTYDFLPRASETTHAGGANDVKLTYPQIGTTNVTYPTGLTATLNSTNLRGRLLFTGATASCAPACGVLSTSINYDNNGYPASEIDFNGNLTNTTYSSDGLLTSRVEAANQSNQRTIQFTWDTTLRRPLTRRLFDVNNTPIELESWIYNSRGQPLAWCKIDQAQAGTYTCSTTGTAPKGVRRITSTYCDSIDSVQCPLIGLLLSSTGPRTDVASTTSYRYYMTTDESGCGTSGAGCHRAGDLYQIVDAAGHVTTFLTYDQNGRVTRQRDANGVLTDYTYNQRGWLLTRTVRASVDGTPSTNDATTLIGYTPYGAVASVKDPDGVQVTYSYDPAHRLTDITDALGNRIHYTLDAAGHKTKEETFDTSNTLRRSLGRTYNTLGQLTGIKDGFSRTVFDASFSDSYDGNGNLVRSADALGIQHKQSYDALNRLITAIDNYNGTDTATQNSQTVFAYDARSKLQGVSDPDSLNTTYDYDGLRNTIAVHSPDTGTSTYVYDAAGNRIQATDARGVVSHSTYDALNRLTTTTYPHSDANVSYRYDEPDSVTGCVGSYPIGRLTSIVETAVTTVYCYDARGNVVKKTQTQGTNVDTVSYTYTLADRLASTRTPDGTSIQYGRDGAGRINAVTVLPPGTSGAGSGNMVTNVSYLPFGPIASYTLGNGQTITRTYDANYAVTDVVSPALNLHFALDAMGNITALGSGPGATPVTETYTYDPLYRLAGLKDSQGQAIETYTYSKAGDRLSKTSNGLATGNYSYQANTHWLKTIGSSARSYDANGNTTANTSGGNSFGYGYDDRSRMVVVQQNGQTVANYIYNAKGQRVGKIGTTTQRFTYNESSQLLGEYGTNNRSYIWLDSVPVAVVDTANATSTLSYVHADGLNTPRAITNAAGTVVWQWGYQKNAFGEASPTASQFSFNLRFPGQYNDLESGLFHNVHRDYDPTTGRYLQSDPLGLTAGPSTYSYAFSTPLSSFDALGLCPDEYDRCRKVKEKAIEKCSALFPTAPSDQSWKFLNCVSKYVEDNECAPGGVPWPENVPDPAIPPPDRNTANRTVNTGLVALLLALGAAILLSPAN